MIDLDKFVYLRIYKLEIESGDRRTIINISAPNPTVAKKIAREIASNEFKDTGEVYPKFKVRCVNEAPIIARAYIPAIKDVISKKENNETEEL